VLEAYQVTLTWPSLPRLNVGEGNLQKPVPTKDCGEGTKISSGRDMGQLFGVDIEIGGHALHIVVILQFLDQLEHLLGGVA